MAARQFGEDIGHRARRFGLARYQHAIGHQGFGNALKHRHFAGGVEIDQHIAAEHDVEIVQPAEGIQQIEAAERHHAAQPFADLPAISRLLEVVRQSFFGKAALDFAGRVAAILGAGNRLRRKIGGDQVDGPARGGQAQLVQQHGDGISFLPRGAASRPDAQPLVFAPGILQRRQHMFRQAGEQRLVAEKAGFAHRHRFGHGLGQGFTAQPQVMRQRRHVLEAEAAHHRLQAALEQRPLGGIQRQAGAAAQHTFARNAKSSGVMASRRRDRSP